MTATPPEKKETKRWRQFEQLVARIHQVLDASNVYDIEEDQILTDEAGATYQVDVVLRPRTAFAGPVLISCKAWKDKVGPGHVREWCAVVQALGASSGIIVAENGFTDVAIRTATPAHQRVTLWVPRPLTLDDFGPDESSPNGYIAGVNLKGTILEPRLREETFTLDAERAEGEPTGRQVSLQFSAKCRDQWNLFNGQGELVGNVWDLFVQRGNAIRESGTLRIQPDPDRFIVVGGVRMRFNGLSVAVELVHHTLNISVNLPESAIAFENVVSREMLIVPLPPSVLELTATK